MSYAHMDSQEAGPPEALKRTRRHHHHHHHQHQQPKIKNPKKKPPQEKNTPLAPLTQASGLQPHREAEQIQTDKPISLALPS